MVSVLFSRPEHDVILSYLYYYSKELVKLSKDLGYKTINRERNNATKKNIIALIKKQNPSLIMFNGHGNEKVICGHNDEIIIASDDNPGVLLKLLLIL